MTVLMDRFYRQRFAYWSSYREASINGLESETLP